jgi:hypothetical protein
LLQDLDQICDAMEARGNAAFMIDIAHARLSVVKELVADRKVEEAKTELARATHVRERTLARPVSNVSNTAHKLKDYK